MEREIAEWTGDRERISRVHVVSAIMYALRQRKTFKILARCALIRNFRHVTTQQESNSETTEFTPTPSGWAPPLGKPAPPGAQPDIPFRVVRSRYGNLPVYLDYKSGGSRILTIIRKVEGDAESLEKMLRDHLKVKGLLSRADSLLGSVTLNGDYKDRTVAWLRKLGF